MNTATILSIFIPIFLTLSAGIGAVFLFRGTYYKSLAVRLDELEEREHKGYLENQRLRGENETLRRLVTGEVALEQLVELNRLHEVAAERRQTTLVSAISQVREAVENAAR
jgi:hypothetical protein